jgi:hypothetical protein
MALVRRAFAHDEARSQSDARGSGPSVVAAFETLQALVLAGEQGSPEEQRRIVAALERAAQEILAATSPGMDRPV